MRAIRRHFNDDKAIKLIVDVLQAELKYDANRLDQIPRSAELLPRQLHKHEAWFNIYAAAYIVSSNVVPRWSMRCRPVAHPWQWQAVTDC